jgi:hypothetical protein
MYLDLPPKRLLFLLRLPINSSSGRIIDHHQTVTCSEKLVFSAIPVVVFHRPMGCMHGTVRRPTDICCLHRRYWQRTWSYKRFGRRPNDSPWEFFELRVDTICYIDEPLCYFRLEHAAPFMSVHCSIQPSPFRILGRAIMASVAYDGRLKYV